MLKTIDPKKLWIPQNFYISSRSCMVGDIFMRIWFTGRACIPKESCNEDDLLSEDHLDFLIQ